MLPKSHPTRFNTIFEWVKMFFAFAFNIGLIAFIYYSWQAGYLTRTEERKRLDALYEKLGPIPPSDEDLQDSYTYPR